MLRFFMQPIKSFLQFFAIAYDYLIRDRTILKEQGRHMQRKLIEGIQNALELGPSSTKLMETVLNIAQAIQQHDVGTVQSLISSLTEAVAQGTFLPHKAKALINKDEALFLSIQKN